MKPKTKNILMVLRILAWMGVLGYAVNLGSQAISFGVSFYNPVASRQLPGVGTNLESLLQNHFLYYVYVMSFLLVVSALFVCLWYQVATLLSKLNMESPFTFHVAKKLETIAYWLFSIWLVSFIGEKYIFWLSKKIGEPLDLLTADSTFLFTAGIVFIISQIFKHGIEMQEENLQTI